MEQPRMQSWPSSPGEMSGRIREFAWEESPLGAVGSWPQGLKSAVELMLPCGFPMIVLWGPDLIQLYNDQYRILMGGKHPAGLGLPTRECWPEVWHINQPIYERVWRGETLTFEDALYPLSRSGVIENAWFTLTFSPLRTEEGRIAGVLVTLFETTARKLAEQRREQMEALLRSSEVRQGFMLRLSDALRPVGDPVEVQLVAARLLGRHLGASRVAYAEDCGDGESVVLARNYTDGVPGIEGVYRYADYGEELLRELRAGRSVVRPDIANDPSLSAAEREAHAVLQLAATLNVPLVKNGRLVAILAVHYAAAHHFTGEEIALACETAERTWAAVELARAESALRASEDRLRTFNSLVPALLWHVDAVGRHASLNARWLEYTGQTQAETQEGGWLAAIHPDDREKSRALHAESISNGSPLELQHRIRRKDGAYRWHQVRQMPLHDGAGNITQWFGAAIDIHEQRLADEALRASEERLRQFGDASTDVLWIRNAETLQFEFVSPALAQVYGSRIDRMPDGNDYLTWAEFILPEDREQALHAVEKVRQGEKCSFEYRIRRADGETRWIRDTVFPLRNPEGEVVRIGGIGRDITEEKETGEHLKVMVDELKHRTRNLLGVVQGIAHQTLRSAETMEQFEGEFSDRLQALGKVHDLLSGSEESEITVGSIVSAELDALATGELRQRVKIEGPPVRLRSSAVQMLSLAIHELATNARKHGALAHRDGRLAVCWSVAGRGRDEPRLELTWRETQLAKLPEEEGKRGYGRYLIEKALPFALGGQTAYAFTPDGLRCEFSLPLSKVVKEESAMRR